MLPKANKPWYWYSARFNELFLDIDRFKESENHIKRRLQGAIESKALDVKAFFLWNSVTENHVHGVMIIGSGFTPAQRYAWEMIFHGDIYRAASNIMRQQSGILHSDILISRKILHREPDSICRCLDKHTKNVMENCVAASYLRGENRTKSFFGKPSNNECTIWPKEIM